MSCLLNGIGELPEVTRDTGDAEPAKNYILFHVEKGTNIINYGRGPLYVSELHQLLNKWSLLETGYSIQW